MNTHWLSSSSEICGRFLKSFLHKASCSYLLLHASVTKIFACKVFFFFLTNDCQVETLALGQDLFYSYVE
jgi:hypothetical protein